MFKMIIVCFYLEAQFIPNKQLQPKETQIYIKLVKYAMQALDIYQVGHHLHLGLKCLTSRLIAVSSVLNRYRLPTTSRPTSGWRTARRFA